MNFRSKRSSFSVGSFKSTNLNEYERYTNSITPNSASSVIQPLQAQLPARSAYYESHYPLFSSGWCRSKISQRELIAISSYREDAVNKIEVLNVNPSTIEHANGISSDGLDIVKFSEISVELPITKLQWDPSPTSTERFITTNDRLKLWEVDYNNQVVERGTFANGSQTSHNNASRPQSLAPLTSFDWNKINSNLVITSSIDSTCTVWDLNQYSSPKTQLIAHDSEVFDVQFIKNSIDVFASVGCDGSMRLFDLRSLDHSTIIYEPSPGSGLGDSANTNIQRGSIPLLRLATSNTDINIIATFSANSDSISLMDLRYPGQPTMNLVGHGNKVNSIKWHPSLPKLLSGGDDCQALVWDLTLLTNQQNVSVNQTEYPSFAYGDTLEINNVTWNEEGDWIGCVSGKGFQGVKVI